MTEKMEYTLRHIDSAVDVDDWAKEECRKVFEGFDQLEKALNTHLKSNFNENETVTYFNGVEDSLNSFYTILEELK